jgi:hypothetical protein
MKARRMVLAFAACAVGVFAFGTTAAQAASPGLGFGQASGHTNAAPAKKGPKPKEYTLCTEYFGGCGPMYVYKKAGTWETPTICWLYEGEECPGLGNFNGPYVKEAKGKITYEINGPFGEPDVGAFYVTKIKKSKPALYYGPWYIGESYYGEVLIET